LLGRVLFFLPTIFSQQLMTQYCIILLMLVSAVTLARLLELRGMAKGFFLALLCVTSQYFLTALFPGQFQFAVFWLLLFLWWSKNRRDTIEIGFTGEETLLLAATGTLLPNVLLAPFGQPHCAIHEKIRMIVRVVLGGIWSMLLFSQLRFAGNTSANAGNIQFVSGAFSRDAWQNYTAFCKQIFVFRPSSQASGWSIAGIVLFALVVLGFVLNRKNRFAQACGVWVAVSLFMLALLGNGSKEMYRYYFGWAYICLLFMLVQKCTKHCKPMRWGIYPAALGLLVWVNSNGLEQLVAGGIV
jgi:hypothetical protein